MTPERWRQVTGIFHAALTRHDDARDAFLRDACRDDPSLRADVDQLLAGHHAAGSFGGTPLISVPAPPPRLEPGAVLGPYRIEKQLGAGGMGEVYAAEDPKLHRQVALKVLPRAASTGSERRHRLEREAQAIAALTHPNVVTLYSFDQTGDVPYLTMELVEGSTLSDLIPREGLALDRLLEIAVPLADAVGAAHARGIVHRDLKPANVMVTAEGRVKVLDFGLAKFKETLAGDVSTVATSELTGEGRIVGTVAYVSPEQAEGRAIDHCSDIFSLGVVLYELATGRRPFTGDTSLSLLSAIVKDTPSPVTELKPALPKELARLIARCLAKDPGRRYQSAIDLRNDLEEIKQDLQSGELTAARVARVGGASRGRLLSAALVTALAALTVATLVLTVLYVRSHAPLSRNVQFEIAVPEMRNPFSFAVSPDGSRVAYAAHGDDGKTMLWIRPLNSLQAQILPGTDDAAHPFWSPDGRRIGFGTADGKLKTIEATGGSPQTLTDFRGWFLGGTWNREGTIVFGSGSRALRQVSVFGGKSEDVTELDASLEEVGHLWPCFLPDGRRFLYLAMSRKRENRAIYIGSLNAKPRTRLMTSDSMAVYTPGFILALRESTLLARPFDVARLEFTGDAFALAEGTSFNEITGRAAFAASDEGALVYRTGLGSSARQWFWMDRKGKQVGSLPGVVTDGLRLSPDGKRVAYSAASRLRSTSLDLWTYDIDLGVTTQLTTNPGTDHGPVWSPDGSSLVFDSSRAGSFGHVLYDVPSNGATPEQLLFKSEPGVGYWALDWSMDGRLVIFAKGQGSRNYADLWVLPRVGELKPYPYLESSSDECEASLSPNGLWLAYTSNESGTYQIVVRPFPKAKDGKWQVSTDGGLHPRWRRDGRELYYLDPKGQIVAVPVTTDGGFDHGKTRVLFNTFLTIDVTTQPWGPAFPYDVTADGQRFLVLAPPEASSRASITVVTNWPSALKR